MTETPRNEPPFRKTHPLNSEQYQPEQDSRPDEVVAGPLEDGISTASRIRRYGRIFAHLAPQAGETPVRTENPVLAYGIELRTLELLVG